MEKTEEFAKKKTKTITFRLSASIIDELKQDAEIEKINLNGLVSRILSNHVLNQDFPIHHLAYLLLVDIIDIPVATHCNTMLAIHFCN